MPRARSAYRIAPWSWLLVSPVFLGSIVLLALNDQVLKHEFPGPLTGKLSDVAGVAMIAMALTAFVGRPRLACTITACAFTALKTLDVVADAAIPVLGGRTLTDATDLVALLVLVPLAAWMRRRHSESETSSGHRLPLKVIAIGAAALATSATSCYEPGIQEVRVDGSQILALEGEGEYFASADGTTWTPQDSDDRPPPDADTMRRRSCASGVCFEIVERRIERREGSDTTVELELSDAEFEALVGNFRDECSSSGDLLGSVAAVDTPDGIVAVVSMGELGVLYRSADGVWLPADVGDNRNAGGTSGGSWAPLLAFGLILLLAFVSIPIGFLARRSGRSVVGYVLGNLGAFVVLVIIGLFVLTLEILRASTGYAIALWIPIHVVTVGVGALMLFLAARARPTASTEAPPYPPVSFGQQPTSRPPASQPPPPTPADRLD